MKEKLLETIKSKKMIKREELEKLLPDNPTYTCRLLLVVSLMKNKAYKNHKELRYARFRDVVKFIRVHKLEKKISGEALAALLEANPEIVEYFKDLFDETFLNIVRKNRSIKLYKYLYKRFGYLIRVKQGRVIRYFALWDAFRRR